MTIMRTYKPLFAAALLFTASCSQEIPGDAGYQTDPDAVRVSASINKSRQTDTRSAPLGTTDEQKKFVAGDRIGISTAVTSEPGIAYTLGSDGATWSPSQAGTYLCWTAPTMKFYAYYPVTNGVSYCDFTQPADQSTVEKIAAADYMIGGGYDMMKTDGNINFIFSRQMSLVVIDGIMFLDQYAGGGYEVSDIIMHSNMEKYVFFNNATIRKPGDVTVKPFHRGGKWYALLIPTSAVDADKTLFTLTVRKSNGAGTPETLIVKGITITSPNMKYTYRLSVGKDRLQVGNVTVGEWTEDDWGEVN